MLHFCFHTADSDVQKYFFLCQDIFKIDLISVKIINWQNLNGYKPGMLKASWFGVAGLYNINT